MTRRHPGGRQEAAHSSLTYLRIVERVTEAGLTQEQLGRAVGASVRTVQNWAKGDSKPTGSNVQRLLDVDHVMNMLREVYTGEGVEIWLNSRNRNLDGARPIELLTDGRIEDVLTEADRLSGV